ncbi:MAG: S53 family peptidase [Candidatus Cybelea sp.]|jgi:kumamolisin
MTTQSPVPIPNTHRGVWPGTTPAAEVSDGDVWLTAWLRPQSGGELDVERARALGATLPSGRAYASRADLAAQTTSDPKNVDVLQRYCAKFHIDVVTTHWRSMVLNGPIRKFIEAFGATAAIYETPDKSRFRLRTDSLHAPPEIAAILGGLFGIHEWPRSHAVGTLHGEATPLSAQEVAARYQLPNADGSGETVGVLQLRGAFRPDDFTKCMQDQGVTAKLPILRRIDNAELTHDIETAKDVESAIDTQIVAALAPGTQIVIYAAPDNERGVLDAIRTALFDEVNRPSILSISFGFPEFLWTPAALTILDELFTVAALLGVSVFCASGDNGAEMDYDGNPHVLAPASSPFTHACGGTDISTGSETAWNKTGGGFSERFAVPPWQGVATPVAGGYQITPGRGLPDFAAQVVPGYTVFFEGTKFAMGGTSTVAPMWAALAARLNQRLGYSIGFFAPLLYGAKADSIFRDVTVGGNDRYRSNPGWNPCAGLGVPIGSAIERALGGSGS